MNPEIVGKREIICCREARKARRFFRRTWLKIEGGVIGILDSIEKERFKVLSEIEKRKKNWQLTRMERDRARKTERISQSKQKALEFLSDFPRRVMKAREREQTLPNMVEEKGEALVEMAGEIGKGAGRVFWVTVATIWNTSFAAGRGLRRATGEFIERLAEKLSELGEKRNE